MRRNRVFKIWAHYIIAYFCVLVTAVGNQDSAVVPATASGLNENSAATITPNCLPLSEGYFRARLGGSISADLDWHDASLECTGGTRPDGGSRMRFSHRFEPQTNNVKGKAASDQDSQVLIFVLGIPSLREGINAQGLPVNITVIRQGSAQFFGTLGDNKCLIDNLEQKPISGIPNRNRSYKVIGRGFCSQPVREIKGDGLLHMTRFDFSGRIDYNEQDHSPELKASPTH
jgi:hypothetical protein